MMQPLSGCRVFDMTQATAGPFCAAQLADFGAEVIHVERPEGDVTRRLHPSFDGTSTTYLSYNRNKKSITLDLKTPLGRQLARELVEKCDILVENNRPGVMEKLGLSYEEVRKLRPDIIYASISGFGKTGPYQARAAYDGVIQGMSGFMSLTGQEGGAYTKAGPSIADLISGLYGAFGIVLAVLQRHRTGEGSFVDCAMLDTMTAMVENALGAYLNTGEIYQPMGNRHPQSALFGPMAAKDGEMMVCMQKESQHQRLFALLGLPDLTQDERFSSSIARRRNIDALMAYIEPVTRQYTMAELGQMLAKENLPAGEIYTIPQVAEDPQIKARGNIIPITDAKSGTYQIYGQPLKFSNIPPLERAEGAQLGEHNFEVLTEILNRTKEEAAELLQQMKGGS